MKLFGKISELVKVVFREDGFEIDLDANSSTTYTADRVVQLPPGDSNHIIVSEAATQALTNKTFDADGTGNNLSNIDDGNIKSAAAINSTKIADGSVDNTEFQTLNGVGTAGAGKIVTTDGTQTLTNKTITSPTGITKADVGLGNVDNTSDATKNAAAATLTNKTIDGDDNTLQDVALTSLKTVLGDANKVIRRNASGVVVSDNSLPNSSAIVTTDATQTLSNKSLVDDTLIVDAADATKQVQIASNGAASTKTTVTFVQSANRTLTMPDATDTLVGKATTDILTNKTLQQDLVDDFLDFNEESAPATPGANKVRVYAKADGLMYSKDDGGNETQLGGSSSGLDSPIDIKNYSLTGTVAANALTVALKTKAGSDPSAGSPVTVAFRNATLATGDYSVVSIQAATSVVVPSGATLGHVSGNTEQIYVYLLNNAGTAELLVTSTILNENAQQTTTAIDANSDSLTGKYSTSARTNVAVRLIGRLQVTETTAGTWATAPSQISLSQIDRSATGMSDAEATKLGLKRYQHGTTYNNGIAPTITLSSGGGTLSSVQHSAFYPYQDQAGTWRLKFNVNLTLSSTSRSQVNISVNGILSPTATQQAISAGPLVATNLNLGYSNDGSSLLIARHATTTTTEYMFSGDIEQAQKPTWAY